jgi:hypothetical protein
VNLSFNFFALPEKFFAHQRSTWLIFSMASRAEALTVIVR